MFLDEVHAISQDRILIIRTKNHLQTQNAPGSQQFRNLAEEGFYIAVANRLQHLNGDYFVESPFQITVVAENHIDEMGNACFFNP